MISTSFPKVIAPSHAVVNRKGAPIVIVCETIALHLERPPFSAWPGKRVSRTRVFPVITRAASLNEHAG